MSFDDLDDSEFIANLRKRVSHNKRRKRALLIVLLVAILIPAAYIIAKVTL